MKKLHMLATAAALITLPISQAWAYRVDLYSAASMNNLAQANAAIAGGPLTATANVSVIEFDDLGDGTRGLFSVNNAFPGGLNTNFAAHVTGNFYVDIAGTWTFGINHDDGARLMIDGALVAIADGEVDNRNTLITNSFAVGLHTVDIVYFETGGGASLEFFGARGTAAFQLVQSVPEPTTLALVGLGLLGAVAARRKRG